MKLSKFLAENPEFDHEVEVEEGDIIVDLLSLWRVVRLDEETSDYLLIGASPNVSGIVQHGIISSADIQVREWMKRGMPE